MADGERSVSVMYSYVRSRQLEGTFSADPKVGTWVVTAQRVGHGWGAPPESAWPYDGDASHWPPPEPPGIDALAKPLRSGAYQRVRSQDDCRVCLAAETPVIVALRVTNQWLSAPGGAIELPGEQDGLTGSHTVVLMGYDDAAERFVFRNSWGVRWGDRGYGYLPYAYFRQFSQEAWTSTTPFSTRHGKGGQGSGKMELEWGVPDRFGDVLHGVELYDAATDDYLGWAFAVVRDGFLDVEELFVKPAVRRTGIGTRLATLLAARAARLNLPLRLWVPHADATGATLATFTRLVRRLGLTINTSDVPWASYVAS